MKIIRDGKEIELTQEEMRAVWEEVEDNYRKDDIESRYKLPGDKVKEALMLLAKALNFNDDYWDIYYDCIDEVAATLGLDE